MSPHQSDDLLSSHHLPLFRDLNEEARERLLAAMHHLNFERGETVFLKGDDCQGVYILLTGKVKLVAKSDHGPEKVMEVVEAGHCLTDGWGLSQTHHAVDAHALTAAKVLLLPRLALETAIMLYPQLAINLLDEVANRYANLMRDMQALTLCSGSRRVVEYLLRQGPSTSQSDAPQSQPNSLTPLHAVVSLPASKGTIASLLSVTPEHFSRILHDLQAQGLIQVQRRDIHIPDVQRLMAFQ